MEQQFKASAQYDHFKGSVAADKADVVRTSKLLTEKGLINDGEHVIGISMHSGAVNGAHKGPVSVTFLVSGLKGCNDIPEMMASTDGPMQVRAVRMDMDIADFLSLFKRFAVTMSMDGMIEGKMYIEE